MSSNNDAEAAMIDSFFLPGGILDPILSDQNEEDEDENGNNERSFPFSRNEHAGTPSVRVVSTTSASQNPWATPTLENNEFVDAQQPHGFWGKHQEDTKHNTGRREESAAAGVIGGSRVAVEGNNAPWQNAPPALLSPSTLFENDQDPDGLLRNITLHQGSELLGNMGGLQPVSRGLATKPFRSPESIPLHRPDAIEDRADQHASRRNGQNDNLRIPLEVDVFPRATNGPDEQGEPLQQKTETFSNANTMVSLKALPPPPGFAAPPGFEQTVLSPDPLHNQIPNYQDNEKGMAINTSGRVQVEEDSIHDNLPLEMLHTRGNDERSCAESATSSLSELTSCGEENSSSSEEENDELELDDIFDNEDENNRMIKAVGANDPNIQVADAVAEKKDSSECDHLLQTNLKSNVTGLQSNAQAESNATTKRLSKSVTPRYQNNGQGYVSILMESMVSLYRSYVLAFFERREVQVRASVNSRSAKAKKKKRSKKAVECSTIPVWLSQAQSSLFATFHLPATLAKNSSPNLFSQTCENSRIWLLMLANVLYVVTSLAFFVCKHAISELLEDNVLYTVCYICLYMMPKCLAFGMQNIALPHWIPHLLSCMMLFILCLPAGVVARKIGITNDNEMISSKFGDTVLRCVRYMLPFMFLLDGFSRPLGTLLSLSAPARLIWAYVLVLFKIGCPLSPFGWLSCAIQILAIRYIPATHSILDKYIFLFGIASIRFVRSLALEKSSKSKKISQ